MARRLELQEILEFTIGSANVYFQPPNNFRMVYPCISYKRDYAVTQFADNYPFAYDQRYMLTYISPDPDDPNIDKIAKLPKCVFVRHFTANDLNHDVFNIYF